MSARIVVIYGPQGSGKSLAAEALRRHYRMSRVRDDEPLEMGKPIRAGDLVLTNISRPDIERFAGRNEALKMARLVHIDQAKREASL